MNKTNTASAIEQRQQFFITLYKKAFPTVARYVARSGGSFDDAKDIFQDALLICYEKRLAGLAKPGNELAYLVGIAKNLWLKRYQENSRVVAIDEAATLPDEPRQYIADTRLLAFLQRAGKRCMDLLKSFYYDEQPLDEIAESYGFSGVRSATVQKYKCLEKVRETIKQKALIYEDFMA